MGLAASLVSVAASAVPRPVVLVPGTAGSQLEARFDKGGAAPPGCPQRRAWHTAWLSAVDLLPSSLPCWADTFRLDYDETTGALTEPPGVEFRVPGYGHTSTVEHLDPALAPFGATAYMAGVVRALVAEGYTRGRDVVAAPYDFRRTPRSDPQLIPSLMNLVDTASAAANNSAVAIFSHSLGSLLVVELLRQAPPAWKRRRVHSWTSVAGVFGGSVDTVRVLVSGNAEGVPLARPLALRAEQRSTESNVWLLPRQEAFGTVVIARRPSRNYTTADLDALLLDAGFHAAPDIRRRLRPLASGPLPAPGVPTRLVVGTGVPTAGAFAFGPGAAWADAGPTSVSTVDGDGTVPLSSALWPLRAWRDTPNDIVHVSRVHGVKHADLVAHGPTIAAFVRSLA